MVAVDVSVTVIDVDCEAAGSASSIIGAETGVGLACGVENVSRNYHKEYEIAMRLEFYLLELHYLIVVLLSEHQKNLNHSQDPKDLKLVTLIGGLDCMTLK